MKGNEKAKRKGGRIVKVKNFFFTSTKDWQKSQKKKKRKKFFMKRPPETHEWKRKEGAERGNRGRGG